MHTYPTDRIYFTSRDVSVYIYLKIFSAFWTHQVGGFENLFGNKKYTEKYSHKEDKERVESNIFCLFFLWEPTMPTSIYVD